MGDIGGLFEGLNVIGFWIIAPFAAYAMKMELLTVGFFHDKKKRDTLNPPVSIPE